MNCVMLDYFNGDTTIGDIKVRLWMFPSLTMFASEQVQISHLTNECKYHISIYRVCMFDNVLEIWDFLTSRDKGQGHEVTRCS